MQLTRQEEEVGAEEQEGRIQSPAYDYAHAHDRVRQAGSFQAPGVNDDGLDHAEEDEGLDDHGYPAAHAPPAETTRFNAVLRGGSGSESFPQSGRKRPLVMAQEPSFVGPIEANAQARLS